MISVVIPTYKNIGMLLANLSHNLVFFKDCEVIIVNDNPEQSIKEEMKSFPKVKLYENKKNIGFGGSVNNGMRLAKNKWVVLLNTDVRLKNDSFKDAVDYFKKDPKLFGVGFVQENRNEQLLGKNRIYFQRGLLNHARAHHFNAGPTAWAEGGACMINKTIFDKLHGFDELFSPFYWEDIDLSYRAWKSGYRVLFSTAIEVVHNHESTIGKYFSRRYTKSIAFRNQFLFVWKNITDTNILVSHFLWLLPNLLLLTVKGEIAFLLGFLMALPKIPAIIKERNRHLSQFTKKDYEVFEECK